jgi:CheY-like chemotaxis protein
MVGPTARQKVLIVDDDDASRVGLQHLLSDAGYDTETASTFHDGLHLLRTTSPDLLVTDLRLGEYNGLQLVASAGGETPAILVTGYPDPVLEADAHQLGAEYVVKPVSPTDLLQLISRKLAGVSTFSPARRWERKAVTREVGARIDDSRARLIDVSYGGVRFALERGPEQPLPASFDIDLPEYGVSVHAELVWVRRTGDQNYECGATLTVKEQPATAGAWRNIVDAVA